ncbi:MAG: TonB-dependent receptor [Candidatus Cloacimonetes bacterium]|nr:TonB-dependent receptor [Candidatus Cloacimonadota bacterium]
MKKVVLFTCIMVISQLSALILKGQIFDLADKQPIPAVNVYLHELRLFTQADEKGIFIIKDIDPGIYHFTFRRIGYHELELTFDFTAPGKAQIFLEREYQPIEGIYITETRADARQSPVTFTDMSREEIEQAGYGQDVPMLLDHLPNVYAYSEAGNGFGYTNLKIRGFDQKRIGVMINGIPLNDPEEHQVYWVDMPDFSESIEDIQIQRGAGNSLYGISSFGAAVNLRTGNLNERNNLESYFYTGSYETYKYGSKFSYRLPYNLRMNLRLSYLQSEGYRDNSASEMWSIYTSLGHLGKKVLTQFNFYTGNEETHAAWAASPESELQQNHRHNPYTYENEIDDFTQPHYELHQRIYFSERLNWHNTFFYIHGRGYYEQYIYSDPDWGEGDLWKYGLFAIPDSLYSDLIRQNWVKKDQLGWIGQISYKHGFGELTLGSYLSRYESDYWGEVEWVAAEVPDFNPGSHYSEYGGLKRYATFYLNENMQPADKINLMLNLHYQKISYELEQYEAGNFTGSYLNEIAVDYDFMNPRAGIKYNFNENLHIYSSISVSQREPAYNELFDVWKYPFDLGVQPLFASSTPVVDENGDTLKIKWSEPMVKAERMINYEAGLNYAAHDWELDFACYWMDFHNEIVPYGGVDILGYPVRGNAEKTVHRGIEVSLSRKFPWALAISGNFAYNDNYFEKFRTFQWDGSMKNYDGNQIAGFPDIVAGARVSYIKGIMSSYLQLKYAGRQYLDNTGDDNRIIDPYHVLDFGLIFSFRNIASVDKLELSFRVNNILNGRYYTAGYYDEWSQEKYYWPAAERNFISGIRLIF